MSELGGQVRLMEGGGESSECGESSEEGGLGEWREEVS